MRANRQVALGAAGVGFEIVCAAALALGASPPIWVLLLLIGLAFILYALFVGQRGTQPAPMAGPSAAAGEGVGDLRGNIFGDNATVSITKHDPPPALNAPRKLLSRSAADLMNIYREHTAVEAEKLIGLYIGEPIQLAGAVYDVSAPSLGKHRVTLQPAEEEAHGSLIFLDFPDAAQGDAGRLRKGEEISVTGRLAKVDVYDVSLEDCDFLT